MANVKPLILDAGKLREMGASDLLPFDNIDGVVPIAQGGTGQQTPSDGFNALSPITDRGDLIAGGIFGLSQRLPGNTDAILKVLTETGDGVNASTPTWWEPDLGSIGGVVGIPQGGHGQTTQVAGFDALWPVTDRGGIPIGNVVGSGVQLAPNITATKKWLQQYGNGSAATNTGWEEIDISTDVDGILPTSQGGTGETTPGAAFNALWPVTDRGGLPIGNAVGGGIQLAPNVTTEKMYLQQYGNGSSANNTAWVNPFASNITLADGVSLILGSSSGTQIGTASTQKIGFWGGGPVTQPANIGAITDLSTGTAGNAIFDINDGVGGVLVAELNDNLATIAQRLNRIENRFSSTGFTS